MIVASALTFIVTESRECSMERFLSFQDKRILNIIKKIIVEDEALTIKTIMKMNDCSQRTVYNDLHFIEEAWGKTIGFQIHGELIYFEERSMGAMRLIVEEMLKKNLAMQIMSELILESFQSAQLLSKKLFVSESRIRREIHDINAFLKPHGFKIRKKNQLFYWHDLLKDELRIRIQLTRLIWEQKRLKDLDTIIPIEMIESFSTTMLQNQVHLNDVQKDFCMLFIYISYLRETQGFHYLSQNQHSVKDHAIKAWIGPQIYHNLYASIHDFFLKINQEEIDKQGILESVHHFLEIASHNYHPEDMPVLIDNLYLQIRYFSTYPYLSKKIFHREKLFGYRYAQQNPRLFGKIIQYFSDFKNFTGIDLSDYVYEIIFHSAMLCPQKTIYRKRRVLLVSDYAKNHAEVLKKKMMQHFPNIDVDTKMICLNSKLETIPIENYDLIVSTLPHPKLKKGNWVLVGDVLSEQDLSKIYRGLYSSD